MRNDEERKRKNFNANSLYCIYCQDVTIRRAVYIRVISISDEITTTLLASKTKVAPISIPRLELSAAVLLSRLMESI